MLAPLHGGFVASAGLETSFTIQAINRFGYEQSSMVTNDNFTVTITGGGFPKLDPDCEGATCPGDNVENPNDMPTSGISLG